MEEKEEEEKGVGGGGGRRVGSRGRLSTEYTGACSILQIRCRLSVQGCQVQQTSFISCLFGL